jgi:type II restriction enzyme
MQSVVYDQLEIPTSLASGTGLDIEVIRRHTQIQIALYIIGLQLGYRTWIAQNDKGILYKDKPLLEQPGIISSLVRDENVISAFPNAEQSARFIDCIWFQNHRFMPAVMEVEHTTGVTSGLTRMKGLQDNIPSLNTRYVIVAPDDDRQKVVDEANRQQFLSLDTRYFSYSAVEELYYICTHRNLHGVNQDFLDCYMEPVVNHTNNIVNYGTVNIYEK